jgi:hypothetical protein
MVFTPADSADYAEKTKDFTKLAKQEKRKILKKRPLPPYFSIISNRLFIPSAPIRAICGQFIKKNRPTGRLLFFSIISHNF